ASIPGEDSAALGDADTARDVFLMRSSPRILPGWIFGCLGWLLGQGGEPSLEAGSAWRTKREGHREADGQDLPEIVSADSSTRPCSAAFASTWSSGAPARPQSMTCTALWPAAVSSAGTRVGRHSSTMNLTPTAAAAAHARQRRSPRT